MRTAYLHTAVAILDAGSDVAGPGGAVTLALCGSWEHEPPCPLAPHHTSTEPVGDQIRLRILFAAEPAAEAEVRERIGSALAAGSVEGPDGHVSSWTLVRTEPGTIRPDEEAHGERLARG